MTLPISRNDRTSKTNGLVGVVQRANGSCDWLVTTTAKDDGCNVRTIDGSKLYSIINENRFNLLNKSYACPRCETYDLLAASYMSIVDEDVFLQDPQRYIDNAFDKAENSDDFDLTKQHN